jgi:hypothetical protein
MRVARAGQRPPTPRSGIADEYGLGGLQLRIDRTAASS